MTIAAWITVLVLVLFGGSGGGGLVYWLLNRNSERAQIKNLEAVRENTLADAATKWQEIIDENATKAYEKVEKRCEKCESELERVVGVLKVVLHNIAPVLEHVAERTDVDVGELNQAVRSAERELWRHT